MVGWIIFAGGFEITGLALRPAFIAEFALVFMPGIAFPYFSIASMRNTGLREEIIAALKPDTLSLTSFEAGMFGWMVLVQFMFWTGGLYARTVRYSGCWCRSRWCSDSPLPFP